MPGANERFSVAWRSPLDWRCLVSSLDDLNADHNRPTSDLEEHSLLIFGNSIVFDRGLC
jgi:hypothetical protein